MYQIFESTVVSDIPLAGLSQAQGEGESFAVRRGDEVASPAEAKWQHSWCEPGGEAVLHCSIADHSAAGAQHFLRFPELAEFHVAGTVSGTTITYFPEPGCTQETLSHLLVDQVLPRVWAHRGHSVLHASAVLCPDGRVSAFLGESGMGKSTLATALVDKGCLLLSDDCVSVVVENSGIRVIPSYCGLRLFEDSISRMALSESVSGAVDHYSAKQRLEVNQSGLGEAMWLERLYILDAPSQGDRITATPLAGAELLAELIKASFLLDVRDSNLGSSQMQAFGGVARALPFASRLTYPRNFQLLPSVVAFLLD
jgi:hypothetical protein